MKIENFRIFLPLLWISIPISLFINSLYPNTIYSLLAVILMVALSLINIGVFICIYFITRS